MTTKLYKQGKPNIPQYIRDIFENVTHTGVYEYQLRGVNQYRPSYGIYADMEKIKAWAERHGAEVCNIRYITRTNNYMAIFEMTDPVAHALEKAGVLK